MKIKDLKKFSHSTKSGYCCACDYDIAGFEEKLRFQYDKGYWAGAKHHQQHILDEIDKDLDNGEFNKICSNETTFINYIKKLLK